MKNPVLSLWSISLLRDFPLSTRWKYLGSVSGFLWFLSGSSFGGIKKRSATRMYTKILFYLCLQTFQGNFAKKFQMWIIHSIVFLFVFISFDRFWIIPIIVFSVGGHPRQQKRNSYHKKKSSYDRSHYKSVNTIMTATTAPIQIRGFTPSSDSSLHEVGVSTCRRRRQSSTRLFEVSDIGRFVGWESSIGPCRKWAEEEGFEPPWDAMPSRLSKTVQ